MSEFTFELRVDGYHVYHEMWTTAVGEELERQVTTGGSFALDQGLGFRIG